MQNVTLYQLLLLEHFESQFDDIIKHVTIKSIKESLPVEVSHSYTKILFMDTFSHKMHAGQQQFRDLYVLNTITPISRI